MLDERSRPPVRALDGIRVRQSYGDDPTTAPLTAPKGPWVQGIDISFSMEKAIYDEGGGLRQIDGIRGEIITHMTMVGFEHNTIGDTSR